MNTVSIGIRNLLRNKIRTALTVLGGTIVILAFVLLRTLIAAWTAGAESSAHERLATRHKVSFILTLPKHYIDIVRGVPGVRAATFCNWFGGKNPRDPNSFFATIAVDAPSFLEVYDDLVLSPDERARWLDDRRGAVVGEQLARRLGVRVGDTFTLTGSIYPGDWKFNIDGIYAAKGKAFDRSQFFFHYGLLNESIAENRRNKIGWIVSRLDAPSHSAEISSNIDRIFDQKDTQTSTMSEQALNASFFAGVSAVLTGLDAVSMILLVIMTLILGNTIAMNVRERTGEYGVLRAIGFSSGHIGAFILFEALATSMLAGVLGVGIAYFILRQALGRWVEENMGSVFPRFELDSGIATAAVGLSGALAAIAALVPAWMGGRLKVVDALRRVG